MLYSRERLEDILPDMDCLAELHHSELQSIPGLLLNPDLEKYYDLEAADILRIYTVRDMSSLELFGYALFFVTPHLHYSNNIVAVQDVIYLHPNERKKGWGKQLIEYADTMLKRERVEIVMHACKTHQSFGGLLESLGYQKIDEIYARRLSDGTKKEF
jgi:GNAT superfamily N-acetyltransferase